MRGKASDLPPGAAVSIREGRSVIWKVVLVAIVLGASAASCGSESGEVAASDQITQRSNAEATSASNPCRAARVEGVFLGLLRGANQRRRSLTLRRLARPPEQNGFGFVTESGSFESRRPRRIFRYLARRSRRGERLKLLHVRLSKAPSGGAPSGPWARPTQGPTADDPVTAASFKIRLTDRGEDPVVVFGKAGINCATGQFYVWNSDAITGS